jgi:hypothetical protein
MSKGHVAGALEQTVPSRESFREVTSIFSSMGRTRSSKICVQRATRFVT